MNVWKIASRWSKDGHRESSILDIFWKHSVVFIYSDGHDLSQICPWKDDKEGDLIAISDGYNIVGIAQPLGKVNKLSELGVKLSRFDRKRLDVDIQQAPVVGFKVRMIALNDGQKISYKERRRFCQIQDGTIINTVVTLQDELSSERAATEFKIEASTKSLKDLLWDNQVKQYVIPVFQRPYAWREQEIERFVGDIIRATQKDEPLFAGTIQLSEKRLISPRGYYFQEVIDGQQRLTTCALILKALMDIEPDNNAVREFSREFSWLESRVSNGQQQERLDDALFSDLKKETAGGYNQYVDNNLIIRRILESHREGNGTSNNEEDGERWLLDVDTFFKQLTEALQFVVIETHAGLSKTLQIFNTINTAGLDLNGGDLFKVRAYEYLKDRHGSPESCFDEISELYESIDRENREIERNASSINEILGIYQTVIVGRSSLPVALNRFGTETFYERLFDSLFGIHQWENFRGVHKQDTSDSRLICLDDIKALIEDRYSLEREYNEPNSTCLGLDTKLAFQLIEWGRYDEYWHLWHVFRFKYRNESGLDVKAGEFIQEVSKLFTVFSVLYAKKVYEVHGFVAEIVRNMFKEDQTMDSVIESVREKSFSRKQEFKDALHDGSFACNPVQKNLLCRLLEWLTLETPSHETLREIFRGGYDIEHIQSYNDRDEESREAIWSEWKSNINGLGNLMLLEYDINRSIGNKPFPDKKEAYEQSWLTTPKEIAQQEVWNLALAMNKLDRDVNAISAFIYE